MKRKQEFTLIELLVVIAIISVLATMLFPVIGNMKERANQTKCAANLSELGKALMLYTNDYDDFLPFDESNGVDAGGGKAHAKNLYLLRISTCDESALFVCPSSTRSPALNKSQKEFIEDGGLKTEGGFSENNISYAYFTGGATKDKPMKKGTVMKTSSGIIADGCLGAPGTTTENTESAIWNHEKSGRWLRVDGSVQNKNNSLYWPDLVGGNGKTKGDWASFDIK